MAVCWKCHKRIVDMVTYDDYGWPCHPLKCPTDSKTRKLFIEKVNVQQATSQPATVFDQRIDFSEKLFARAYIVLIISIFAYVIGHAILTRL